MNKWGDFPPAFCVATKCIRFYSAKVVYVCHYVGLESGANALIRTSLQADSSQVCPNPQTPRGPSAPAGRVLRAHRAPRGRGPCPHSGVQTRNEPSHPRCHAPGGKWPARPAGSQETAEWKSAGDRSGERIPPQPRASPEALPPGPAAGPRSRERQHRPDPRRPPAGPGDPARPPTAGHRAACRAGRAGATPEAAARAVRPHVPRRRRVRSGSPRQVGGEHSKVSPPHSRQLQRRGATTPSGAAPDFHLLQGTPGTARRKWLA